MSNVYIDNSVLPSEEVARMSLEIGGEFPFDMPDGWR